MSAPSWNLLRTSLAVGLIATGITDLIQDRRVDPIYVLVAGIVLLGTIAWDEFWFRFTVQKKR